MARPPKSVDDYKGLLAVSKVGRCCGACGSSEAPLDYAHVHRRKKLSVGEIARRPVGAGGFRDPYSKLVRFREALGGCYLLCRGCHIDYDSSGKPPVVPVVVHERVVSYKDCSVTIKCNYFSPSGWVRDRSACRDVVVDCGAASECAKTRGRPKGGVLVLVCIGVSRGLRVMKIKTKPPKKQRSYLLSHL